MTLDTPRGDLLRKWCPSYIFFIFRYFHKTANFKCFLKVKANLGYNRSLSTTIASPRESGVDLIVEVISSAILCLDLEYLSSSFPGAGGENMTMMLLIANWRHTVLK